ncbi:MAG: ABC transporter ATP-binding protein [Gemmatimonadales bacterium]|nr:MAG: ABC transporter ATP-binding protein [Gemmatimonadales bacterium]
MTGPSHPHDPHTAPAGPAERAVPALRMSGARIPFGGDMAPGAPGLDGIDLEVQAGERLVLVGASGEGKTTLLRAVAGIAPLARGRIEVGGADVTHAPPERRGAVYLHQAPVLFPHLSVEENVAFPLRIRGVSRAEIRERVHEVLRSVQLEELGSRGPAALSGGQRHRVALARAVVARPTLLLLDEPLSSLDPRLRHEVRDAIVRLQERYRPGIVLVTHDLEEAGLLGHRIGIVMDGGIAQLATPAELFRAPASLAVARFLGYRNELPVRRSGGAWVSAAPGGAAVRLEVEETGVGDAEEAAAGDGVAVFPPGSLRIVPEGGGESRVGHAVRVAGRVVGVGYPGPRPVARVEVGRGTGGADGPGGEGAAEGAAGGAVFEVMIEGEVPSAGDAVTVEIEVARVVVFAGR